MAGECGVPAGVPAGQGRTPQAENGAAMNAILLDWDGVLVDSIELYLDLYRQACRRWGKTLPIATAGEFREWYNPQWEQNYYQMGFTSEELREVMAFSQGHLDYSRARFYPGIPKMLRSLTRDFQVAIVSTTPSALIRNRLEAGGLGGILAGITGGDDSKSEKVEKIRRTLAELGASGGVMVGDTPLDVTSGEANGLSTVGVTYGWCAPQRVQKATHDRLVHSSHDLEDAIRALMSPR